MQHDGGTQFTVEGNRKVIKFEQRNELEERNDGHSTVREPISCWAGQRQAAATPVLTEGVQSASRDPIYDVTLFLHILPHMGFVFLSRTYVYPETRTNRFIVILIFLFLFLLLLL